MSFQLSKWYFDCISSDGDVFLGYSGELRWQPLSLHYESLLVHPAGAATQSRTSLRKGTPPQLKGDLLRWESAALGIDGQWRRDSAPVAETIYRSSEGQVAWSCCLPRAAVEIATGGGKLMRGTGYAEQLTISIPPWRLPIRQLRWGRIACPSHALVWIEWQGEFQRAIAYRNGVPVTPLRIDDGGLALADGLFVRLDRGCVLRDGALGTTALAAIPGIERIAPARMLAARERKWRSRALISGGREPEQRTWAIHEVVKWPEASTALSS